MAKDSIAVFLPSKYQHEFLSIDLGALCKRLTGNSQFTASTIPGPTFIVISSNNMYIINEADMRLAIRWGIIK